MQALLDAIATMGQHSDAARLFHGRGGLHPGCEHLALDVYPPVLVLTIAACAVGTGASLISRLGAPG